MRRVLFERSHLVDRGGRGSLAGREPGHGENGRGRHDRDPTQSVENGAEVAGQREKLRLRRQGPGRGAGLVSLNVYIS